MPRVARLKVESGSAWYHVCARVAGHKDDRPLEDMACQRTLVALLRHFAKAYFCEVAAFCVMGNHYHLVLRLDEPREVDREELEARAKVLYPRSDKQLKAWSPKQWSRLEARLFDLSELMRNLQAGFARWYNGSHERRGRFWAERFKSTLLEEGEAVLDAVLYVELNPVRAGLVERPEDWEGSSSFFRAAGTDRWLGPVTELVGQPVRKKAQVEYRYLLYHRGAVPSREGQASIPEDVLEAEARRGYEARGAYAKRLRYFADGVALGSEEFVRGLLDRLRQGGRYQRRRHPVAQPVGGLTSLREQRSHAVTF